MTKKEEMIQLRERDLSYQQIADIYHLSRQRVYQIIGKENVRRNNVQIENIVYKGIYDFMCENPKISFSAIVRKIMGNSDKKKTRFFIRFLHNTTDEGKLTIGQIKRLSELTGKTFEELFERRD